MAYEFSENEAMVYEVLTNIENAVSTLLERTEQIRSANDFALSPSGMEKLDAACMVLLAIGESIKNLDKLTNKELLPTCPSIDWKGLMGVRDIIAHRYFQVDPDAVFAIIKEEMPPVKEAITYFKEVLFSTEQ